MLGETQYSRCADLQSNATSVYTEIKRHSHVSIYGEKFSCSLLYYPFLHCTVLFMDIGQTKQHQASKNSQKREPTYFCFGAARAGKEPPTAADEHLMTGDVYFILPFSSTLNFCLDTFSRRVIISSINRH
jgi:hypothetical protein